MAQANNNVLDWANQLTNIMAGLSQLSNKNIVPYAPANSTPAPIQKLPESKGLADALGATNYDESLAHYKNALKTIGQGQQGGFNYYGIEDLSKEPNAKVDDINQYYKNLNKGIEDNFQERRSQMKQAVDEYNQGVQERRDYAFGSNESDALNAAQAETNKLLGRTFLPGGYSSVIKEKKVFISPEKKAGDYHTLSDRYLPKSYLQYQVNFDKDRPLQSSGNTTIVQQPSYHIPNPNNPDATKHRTQSDLLNDEQGTAYKTVNNAAAQRFATTINTALPGLKAASLKGLYKSPYTGKMVNFHDAVINQVIHDVNDQNGSWSPYTKSGVLGFDNQHKAFVINATNKEGEFLNGGQTYKIDRTLQTALEGLMSQSIRKVINQNPQVWADITNGGQTMAGGNINYNDVNEEDAVIRDLGNAYLFSKTYLKEGNKVSSTPLLPDHITNGIGWNKIISKK